MRTNKELVLRLWLLLGVVGVGVAAEGPLAVSPGGPSELALVEDRCPTFTWGAVEGARSYSLVVYRLGEEGEEARSVLRQDFPGSVYGWTPSLDRCLERGGRYAWSVRSITGVGSSAWSLPSLFRVTSAPSIPEIAEALEHVRAYLGRTGSAELEGAGTGSYDEPQLGKAADTTLAAMPLPAASALGGADFSIDSDGNVLGASFGGDGSALTNLGWDNLANVPADFADGTDAYNSAFDTEAEIDAAVANNGYVTGNAATICAPGQFLNGDGSCDAGFLDADGTDAYNSAFDTEAEIDAAVANNGYVIGNADGDITLGNGGDKITIGDMLRLTPIATPPATCNAGTEGSLYADSSTNELCYCDGTQWTGLVSAGTCA